jgi:hypothetical protein
VPDAEVFLCQARGEVWPCGNCGYLRFAECVFFSVPLLPAKYNEKRWSQSPVPRVPVCAVAVMVNGFPAAGAIFENQRTLQNGMGHQISALFGVSCVYLL